ncbi:hypothetical protein HYPSUDRAFT_60669 [Hypholoma sublateritium FD-334 SS-4]|uniref:Uncharacterized protein n=1 Tax=Hypholoma sublateritium (strain FD-334 SS-4) TaxID=945553 RepID=A0A0D2N0B1_HYPSF|nr:hypothetical protein HYPSUDRAFT_60669 [Hypholoma sublateritium FD-334 SS-4]
MACAIQLCNAPPIIIDEIAEREHEHAILEDYRLTPYNIVLDSLCPQIAPHIVITPALEQWDAEYIAQNNRAGPQFFPHLTVPPFFGSTCRMHTYEEFMRIFYQQPMHEPYPMSQELCNETLPVACVDVSSDTSQVEPQTPSYPPRRREFEFPPDDVHWTEFLHEIARILIRRVQQLVAIEASLRACAFRNRYDCPNFVDSVERPYEWTDPAKAIFADYTHRSPRNSFFIESDVPFAAPHIIIHMAPSDHPILLSAYPSSMQDGSLLTVPLHYESSRSHFEAEDEHYSSDGSSDMETLGPQTPSDLQRVGSGFFSGFAEEAEGNVVSACRGYKAYRVVDQSKDCDSEEDEPSLSFTSYLDNGPSKFFISYDDDDWDTDSLPDMETDEWFVQDRARSLVGGAF